MYCSDVYRLHWYCKAFLRKGASNEGGEEKTSYFPAKSQCSTLVRNTVVRVTFKVNGKPPILGSRSPLTPWPIDLKFHMGDYVGQMTPHAKKCKNRQRGADPAKGWNVNVKCGSFFILFFIEFLARLWRPHFCTDRHRFCARWRVSVGIDFLGGSDC